MVGHRVASFDGLSKRLAGLCDATATGGTGSGVEAPRALGVFDEQELIVHVDQCEQGV